MRYKMMVFKFKNCGSVVSFNRRNNGENSVLSLSLSETD
jgi:hypothetical protein